MLIGSSFSSSNGHLHIQEESFLHGSHFWKHIYPMIISWFSERLGFWNMTLPAVYSSQKGGEEQTENPVNGLLMILTSECCEHANSASTQAKWLPMEKRDNVFANVQVSSITILHATKHSNWNTMRKKQGAKQWF